MSESNKIKDIPQPSLLLYQIRARRCTVGELVDFAHNVPSDWVCNMAHTLVDALNEAPNEAPIRRRKLVLLGALVNRLIFEIEGIPKSRTTRL